MESAEAKQADLNIVGRELASSIETSNEMTEWFKFSPDDETNPVTGTIYQYGDDSSETKIGTFSIDIELDDDRPNVDPRAFEEPDRFQF